MYDIFKYKYKIQHGCQSLKKKGKQNIFNFANCKPKIKIYASHHFAFTSIAKQADKCKDTTISRFSVLFHVYSLWGKCSEFKPL